MILLQKFPFNSVQGITEAGARFSHGHWWLVWWVMAPLGLPHKIYF